MANLGRAGNVAEVSDEEMNQNRGGGALLENGWYRCALVKDTLVTPSWGTGLNMELQVITGDFENRRIFEFLCLEHDRSEKAQHIARVKLKEFATAAGHRGDDIPDTDRFYGKPVMVKVYRAVEENEKYAEEDGKKPRVDQFMSCEQWKAEKSDEPTPGLQRKKQTPAREEAPPPPADDDDIPF